MVQTVPDCLLDTLRCSKGITVCRKIKTVFVSIDISPMYVFHFISPLLPVVVLQDPEPDGDADDKADQNAKKSSSVHQTVGASDILRFHSANRVSDRRFFV